MFKRIVPIILLTPIVLLALAGLAEPSRPAAAGNAEMAPAPVRKGAAKPGMWKDYNPADAKGSKGQSKQKFSSGELVVIAYTIIWGVVLIYVLLLALRQSRLRSELEQLRRQLDKLDPPAVAGDSKKT